MEFIGESAKESMISTRRSEAFIHAKRSLKSSRSEISTPVLLRAIRDLTVLSGQKSSVALGKNWAKERPDRVKDHAYAIRPGNRPYSWGTVYQGIEGGQTGE